MCKRVPVMKNMNKIKKYLKISSLKYLIKYASSFWGSIIFIASTYSILSVISVSNAIITRNLIDHAINSNFSSMIYFLVLMGVLFVLRMGISSGENIKSTRLNEKMSNKKQKDLIQKLYDAEWLKLNKIHSGDILLRLTNDINNISNFWVNIFPSIIALFVQLILAFITLFYFDKNLAIFAFVLGPISAVIGFVMGRKVKRLQHNIQKFESINRSYIDETIKNIVVIKTFQQEENSIKKVSENQANKYKWVKKKSNFSAIASFAIGSGYWLGYFAAFVWGIIRLSKKLTSFGTFTAFIQLVAQVQGPFEGLMRTMPQVASCLASVDRVMEFESIELEKNKNKNKNIESHEFRKLVLKNLSFQYSKGRPVLSNISLSINKGELIAIVGVSGEGKTTLIRLLLALIGPESGEAFIQTNDGQKFDISPDTRSFFSYVPQGNTLFSGTILDNLRLGKKNINDEELEEALRIACAWDFVQSLPDKEYTRIGEFGIGLSEGQAQRLAIARALLRKSQILLLDEATSALDIHTEQQVLSNISKMVPDITCIAITHRISVTEVCDKVFRISNSGVIEEYQKEVI